MVIVWRSKMSIDKDIIDEDHKTLIKIINSVETALREGKRGKDLMNNIQELKKYTDDHFEREESILKKIKCPNYDQQTNKHEYLIIQLNDIISDLLGLRGERDTDKAIPKLVKTLKSWLMGHVLKDDVKIKPFIEAAK
ncbi:MAG TPA: hemerythrin family protein [Nitrospinota bacterium]|jgi:hemerythrin|nr:hemerythrin family protein [Nitrospinota bacterium]|tara:strand:- start:765 stop:1178 length:414 start_codon:yes stop_codon:yes gene_type:complete